MITVSRQRVAKIRRACVLNCRAAGNNFHNAFVCDNLLLNAADDGVIHGRLIAAIIRERPMIGVLLISPRHMPSKGNVFIGALALDFIEQGIYVVVSVSFAALIAALLNGDEIPIVCFKAHGRLGVKACSPHVVADFGGIAILRQVERDILQMRCKGASANV